MHADREDAAPDGPTVRHMHDVFSSPWCRAILASLRDRGGTGTVPAIARDVSDSLGRVTDSPQADAPRTEPTDRRRIRARVRAMEELGIVGYDPGSDGVWIPEDVAISVTSRPGGVRAAAGSHARPDRTSDI